MLVYDFSKLDLEARSVLLKRIIPSIVEFSHVDWYFKVKRYL